MHTAKSLLLMANAMAEMANTVHYDYGPQFASPQFFSRKHPFKTYGAQQRDAKRRKRAKNHKK